MSIEDEINEEPEDSLPDASRGDLVLIEAVSQHFEEVLGPIDIVFHEAKSRFVHIDVHRIVVEEGEDICTLFTTGMAEKPMNVPAEVQDPDEYRYAELVLHLPAEWPRDWDDLKSPSVWWPIGTMVHLARLAHERESWVWGGHTLANGEDDPSPYAPDVGFCAALVCPSYLLPDDAEIVNVPDGRNVVLLTVAFLYLQEYEFCIEHGAEAFLDRVENFGLSPADFFVLDKSRPNVCA